MHDRSLACCSRVLRPWSFGLLLLWSGTTAHAAPPVVPGDLQVFVQAGHGNGVIGLAFSADGLLALSGGGNAAHLWDVRTGREIRSYHSDSFISGVGLPPDGKSGLLLDDDGIQLRELLTGRTLRRYPLPGCRRMALTQDGRRLLAVCKDHVAALELTTGKVAWRTPPLTWIVEALAVSPDGRWLAGGSFGEELVFWNAQTGAQVRKVKLTGNGVAAAAFTPDSRQLLTGTVMGQVVLWNVATGQQVRRFQGHTKLVQTVAVLSDGRRAVSGSADGTLRVWELATGKSEPSFGNGTFVDRVALAADGRTLIVADGRGLSQWDVETRQVIRSFATSGSAGVPLGVLPDGRRALLVGESLRLWDLHEARLLREWGTGSGAAALSRDGRLVATAVRPAPGDRRVDLLLWDLERATLLATFRKHQARVFALAFSPDGRTLASTDDNLLTYLWDVTPWAASGTLATAPAIAPGAASPGTATPGTASPGTASPGTATAGTATRSTATSGPAAPASLPARARSPFPSALTDRPSLVTQARWFKDRQPAVALELAWLPDSRTLLLGYRGRQLGFWDAITLQNLRSPASPGTFKETTDGYARHLDVAPDGRQVLVTRYDGQVERWDVEQGQVSGRLPGLHSLARFTPDGRGIVASGRPDQLELWAVGGSKPRRTFPCRHWIAAMAFTPDGRHLLTTGQDATVRLWNLENGRSFSLISDGAEWAIFSDEGWFDASRNGGYLVTASQGFQAFAVDQFAPRFNRPDLLLAPVGLADPHYLEHLRALHERRLARARLTQAELTGPLAAPRTTLLKTQTEGKFTTLSLRFDAAGPPLRSYQLFVNDVPLFGLEGKPLSGQSQQVTARVELTSGDNKLEASCQDQRGAESARAITQAFFNQPAPGDLYLLALGVSKYQQPGFELGFAAQDARDLEALLKQAGRGFRQVHTRVLTDAQVTPAAIRAAGKFFKPAGVDDTALLFIAGHGLHGPGPAAPYYFLTHGGDPRNLAKTAAEFDLFEELLLQMAPRRKLFLMDTCESGERDPAAEAVVTRATERGLTARGVRGLTLQAANPAREPPRPFLFRQDRFIHNDLLRRSGAVVFSAARGDEYSYESPALQNGFFTEELLRALTSPVADRDRDGRVSGDELRTHVMDAVARATGDAQHPTVDRDNLAVRFSFPIVGP